MHWFCLLFSHPATWVTLVWFAVDCIWFPKAWPIVFSEATKGRFVRNPSVFRKFQSHRKAEQTVWLLLWTFLLRETQTLQSFAFYVTVWYILTHISQVSWSWAISTFANADLIANLSPSLFQPKSKLGVENTAHKGKNWCTDFSAVFGILSAAECKELKNKRKNRKEKSLKVTCKWTSSTYFENVFGPVCVRRVGPGQVRGLSPVALQSFWWRFLFQQLKQLCALHFFQSLFLPLLKNYQFVFPNLQIFQVFSTECAGPAETLIFIRVCGERWRSFVFWLTAASVLVHGYHTRWQDECCFACQVSFQYVHRCRFRTNKEKVFLFTVTNWKGIVFAKNSTVK